MNAWALIGIGLGVMMVVMLVLWSVQRATRNAGIVDIAWSFGTGLMAVWFAWGASWGAVERRWLVGAIAGVWGARLGLHLLRRLMREAEDGRYQELREAWGAKTQRNLLIFFQIQATWSVLFALPMLAAASNPAAALAWHDWAGLAVFLASLVGESIADAQLARFKADPANEGQVCDVGLWRYTRHPNYFFEWQHWWAYVLIGWGGPWWPATLAGPIVMYLFLRFVTGIPPTERRAVRTRGDAYRRYQQTTNAFFPGPPRPLETAS